MKGVAVPWEASCDSRAPLLVSLSFKHENKERAEKKINFKYFLTTNSNHKEVFDIALQEAWNNDVNSVLFQCFIRWYKTAQVRIFLYRIGRNWHAVRKRTVNWQQTACISHQHKGIAVGYSVAWSKPKSTIKSIESSQCCKSWCSTAIEAGGTMPVSQVVTIQGSEPPRNLLLPKRSRSTELLLVQISPDVAIAKHHVGLQHKCLKSQKKHLPESFFLSIDEPFWHVFRSTSLPSFELATSRRFCPTHEATKIPNSTHLLFSVSKQMQVVRTRRKMSTIPDQIAARATNRDRWSRACSIGLVMAKLLLIGWLSLVHDKYPSSISLASKGRNPPEQCNSQHFQSAAAQETYRPRSTAGRQYKWQRWLLSNFPEHMHNLGITHWAWSRSVDPLDRPGCSRPRIRKSSLVKSNYWKNQRQNIWTSNTARNSKLPPMIVAGKNTTS